MTLGRPSSPGRAPLWVWLPCILAFAPSANAAGAERRVVVATTCDLHGAIEATPAGAGAGQVAHGGVLALSGYLAALRREVGEALLYLDAGDLFVGTLAAKASRGAAVIEAFNLMGLDAAALGNHEFDFGRPVLAARMQEARFPFLAANVDQRTPQGATRRWPEVAASRLFRRGGVRVGVIGVASPFTAETTLADQVRDLTFAAPAPTVVAEARALRARGAELVVLLAHVGGACFAFDDPHDVAGGCPGPAGGELFALVEALPPGTVDVAIGGHTHGQVAHWLGDTAVLQAGTRGEALVYMEARLGEDGRLARGASVIHPPVDICLGAWGDGRCRGTPPPGEDGAARPARFLGHAIASDPRVAGAMAPHLAAVRAQARAPAGVALPEALDPLALCQVAADGMRRQTGADLAIQNTGGFRLTLPPTALSRGQIFEAMPFDNALVVVRLSAAQVATLWAKAHAGGTHQLPPMCHSGPLPAADGAPRDLMVVTNAFVAGGGEGAGGVFAGLPKGAVRPAEGGVAEALLGELRRRFPAPGLPGGAEGH